MPNEQPLRTNTEARSKTILDFLLTAKAPRTIYDIVAAVGLPYTTTLISTRCLENAGKVLALRGARPHKFVAVSQEVTDVKQG
jgi:hypothetical protein